MRNLWHIHSMDMPSFITQNWQTPWLNQPWLSFLRHVSLPSMLCSLLVLSVSVMSAFLNVRRRFRVPIFLDMI